MSMNQAVKIASVIANDSEDSIKEKYLHDAKLRMALEHLSRMYFDIYSKQEDFIKNREINELKFKQEYECIWIGESENSQK